MVSSQMYDCESLRHLNKNIVEYKNSYTLNFIDYFHFAAQLSENLKHHYLKKVNGRISFTA